jgi:hypothetical protein
MKNLLQLSKIIENIIIASTENFIYSLPRKSSLPKQRLRCTKEKKLLQLLKSTPVIRADHSYFHNRLLTKGPFYCLVTQCDSLVNGHVCTIFAL